MDAVGDLPTIIENLKFGGWLFWMYFRLVVFGDSSTWWKQEVVLHFRRWCFIIQVKKNVFCSQFVYKFYTNGILIVMRMVDST